MILELKGIYKEYQQGKMKVPVLKDVNFSMEEGEYVNGSAWIWPASDMDFWKIDNKVTSVKIKWSHNCFEDYKTLSYQFYKCGYKTFEEVIGSGHDNIKSDMWF